jgi:hypothetical protein
MLAALHDPTEPGIAFPSTVRTPNAVTRTAELRGHVLTLKYQIFDLNISVALPNRHCAGAGSVRR